MKHAEMAQTQEILAPPLWARVKSWLMLVPLVYFVTDGQILAWTRSSSDTVVELSTVQVLIGLFMWFLAIALMLPSYRRVFKLWRRNWILSAFLTYLVLSTFWAPEFLTSFRKALFLCILMSFGYFISADYQPDEQMNLIYVVGCILVVGSYLMAIVNPGRAIDSHGNWNGLLGHKNPFSINLCLVVMALFYRTKSSTVRTIGGCLCVALVLVAIYLSQSRTGWVACAFAAVYLCFGLIIQRFRNRDALVIFMSVVTLIAVISIAASQNVSFIMGILGKDSTLTGRTEIWQNAMWAIGRRLLWGYGYAGFWNGLTPESNAVNVQLSASLTDTEKFNHAHNAILTLTLQVGLIGICMFLLALIQALWRAFRIALNTHSLAALWYLSVLLILCVAGMDESTFMNYMTFSTLIFACSIAGINRLETEH